jgi:hypothetical protein
MISTPQIRTSFKRLFLKSVSLRFCTRSMRKTRKSAFFPRGEFLVFRHFLRADCKRSGTLVHKKTPPLYGKRFREGFDPLQSGLYLCALTVQGAFGIFAGQAF